MDGQMHTLDFRKDYCNVLKRLLTAQHLPRRVTEVLCPVPKSSRWQISMDKGTLSPCPMYSPSLLNAAA